MALRYPGLQALTTIRGPFALLVVVRHCMNSAGVDEHLDTVPGIVSNAEFLLDCFFILSGFLIAMLYQDDFFSQKSPGVRKAKLRSYLVLRIARIYPLHLATLLFLGVSVAVFGPGDHPDAFSAEAFTLNLFMVHSWGFLNTLSFNFPSWTVSTEWFTYLIFPLIVLVTNKLTTTFQILAGIAVCLFGVYLFTVLHPSGHWDVQLGWGMYRNAVDFIIGCLLARLAPLAVNWNAVTPRTWDLLSLVLLAATVAAINERLWAVLIVGGFTAAIFALILADGPFAELLRKRPLVYLGDLSFSIYMLHVPVILVLNKLAPSLRMDDFTGFMIYYAVVVFLTLVLSVLSFRYFEMPLRRSIRDRFATARHKVPPQPEIRDGSAVRAMSALLPWARRDQPPAPPLGKPADPEG